MSDWIERGAPEPDLRDINRRIELRLENGHGVAGRLTFDSAGDRPVFVPGAWIVLATEMEGTRPWSDFSWTHWRFQDSAAGDG